MAHARVAIQRYTCSKNIYSVGSILSVLKPPVNYRTICLKLRENGWNCVLCTRTTRMKNGTEAKIEYLPQNVRICQVHISHIQKLNI